MQKKYNESDHAEITKESILDFMNKNIKQLASEVVQNIKNNKPAELMNDLIGMNMEYQHIGLLESYHETMNAIMLRCVEIVSDGK